MTDAELLEYAETKTIEAMLSGCELDDHLGGKDYDAGSWSVTFRAETISRLIDMAKGNKQ